MRHFTTIGDVRRPGDAGHVENDPIENFGGVGPDRRQLGTRNRQRRPHCARGGQDPGLRQDYRDEAKYLFSPYSLVARTRKAVVTLAFNKLFVFPVDEVTISFAGNGHVDVDPTTLPLVAAPKIDRGVLRYKTLRNRNKLERQYRAGVVAEKQRTCPDCAMLATAQRKTPFLIARWGSVTNDWHSMLSGIPLWTPADASPAQDVASNRGAASGARSTLAVVQNCTSDGYCWSSSSGSSGGPSGSGSSGYYYYGPCGSSGGSGSASSSSSSSGSGENCAGRGKKKGKKKPTQRQRSLANCLGQAAIAGTQPDNGMHYWQGYCSSRFTGAEAAECFAVGPRSQAEKEGFCAARFG
jgi:uncharacterized membrane protein YgcG